MEYWLQLVTTGLAIGSIYAVIALGFVIIYKATKIFNFAHPELVLFGGYLAIVLVHYLPFPIAILATILIAGLLGFVIERLFMRPLFGQPLLSVIIVTLALGYIIRGLLIGLWGVDTKTFPPYLPTGTVDVAGVMIPLVGLWALLTALILLSLLLAFFHFTRIGIAMRAVANDQLSASTLGVSLRRIFAYSWALASIVGAVGGIVLGTWLGVNIALAGSGLKVIAAILLGGLDSIPGAILGGFLLGLVENVVGGWVDAHLLYGFKDIVAFVVILLVLLVKPYGLFGTEQIERL